MIKLALGITAMLLAVQSTKSLAGTIRASDLSVSFHSSYNSKVPVTAGNAEWTEDIGSGPYIPNLGEASHPGLELICSCSNALSGEVRRIGFITRNDRLRTSVYAPMRQVNNALSLVGTALQTKLADPLVTLVQAVSLVSRRNVNAEVSYEMDVNRYSRVASSLVYRLHPDAASGSSDIVASMTYSSRF